MNAASRPFDLILLGASGFTGKLVAEYLIKQYSTYEDLRWAMAGRNREKLIRTQREIGGEHIPIILADSVDQDSIDTLTAQTRVLCSTVGPYAKYGSITVASCVANGTHYCDLTGEVPWIRRMIDLHHTSAIQKEVRIVHCCGYDSIPSELGVHYLQQKALQDHGKHCTQVKTGIKASKGGLSGGTIASMTHMLEEAERDKSIYGLLFNTYGLNPRGMQEGPDQTDLRKAMYDHDFKSWKSPFIMAAINTRIVRRGHALLDHPFGRDFRYDEFVLTGDGVSGRLKAYVTALPMSVLARAKPGSVLMKLLGRFAPKPGEGPSRTARENGYWVFELLGTLPNGDQIKARVKGDMDPGYG
ncbi:MAG: saccharopine dehydrogenase, partial [Saprospiraceae bacterium]|nr:saccharopine dehydrogenase [Saprospiraceae bacterium]